MTKEIGNDRMRIILENTARLLHELDLELEKKNEHVEQVKIDSHAAYEARYGNRG